MCIRDSPGIRQKSHTGLALIFRLLCPLNCHMKGRAGGNAHRNTFCLCPLFSCGKGFLIFRKEYSIVHLRIQYIRQLSLIHISMCIRDSL